MSKIRIVSLVLAIASLCVAIIALQMDYGSARKCMMMLSVALLVLAIDPTLSLYKKKKPKTIDESEEYGPARISLSSAVPIDSTDRKWQKGRDVYLKFLDIESDDDYFIHYINGKADEVFVGELHFLEIQGFDEVFEGYETLDGLLAATENEEIENLCLISSDDFEVVRHIYHDLPFPVK